MIHYDDDFKQKVCNDVANGATINEVVKKYDISVYFAKKWSGEVYRKIDLDMMVRRRYSLIVCEERDALEADMANVMTEEEADALSDETWDKFDDVLKNHFYEFAKKIIKAN